MAVDNFECLIGAMDRGTINGKLKPKTAYDTTAIALQNTEVQRHIILYYIRQVTVVNEKKNENKHTQWHTQKYIRVQKLAD